MTKPATKSSWKTLDAPVKRQPLGYEQLFTNVDAERLQEGLIPQVMEDKWFVYFENDWLYLHRSWTGSLVYWLKLDRGPAGIRVTDSWVNRDSEQYSETDISYDRLMLDFLLRCMMLGHDVAFPVRTNDISNKTSHIYQHTVVGGDYPMKTVSKSESSGDNGGKMARFTLQSRQWYACMMLGDEFDVTEMGTMSPSPIRVDEIKPLGTGNSTFELSFFHANYPAGAQAKTYKLQTIHRGKNSALVKSTDHDPARFLYVTDISKDWIRSNFPQFAMETDSPQDALNQTFGAGPE